MRIALVGTELCSIQSPTGGLERLLQGWALELSEHHEVILVDLTSRDAPAKRHLSLDVLEVATPSELPRALRSFAPDVVQVNNRPLYRTEVGLRINTFHNYPNAWSADGDLDDAAVAEALRHGHSTAVSASLARHIEARFGLADGQVCVTLPFVDDEFFDAHHHGGAGILFPNRLLRKKGPDVVVKALEEVSLIHKATFLDYVTPFLRGSEEHLAMRGAIQASGATLLPAVEDRAELMALYAGADLVVAVATQPEGMGLVPLEAQAVGARVVTAGPGGLREATFEPNVHLPEAEPHSLGRALVETLASHDKMASNAVLRERFSRVASTSSLRRVWAAL